MPKRATAKTARMKRGIEMPPEIMHIYVHGHLYAEEAHAHGWLPVMTCAYCHAEVDLLLRHGPYTDEELHDPTRVISLMWDTDVAVMCRCCSLPHCPHQARDTQPLYHDGGATT